MSFPRENFRKDYVPFVRPTDASLPLRYAAKSSGLNNRSIAAARSRAKTHILVSSRSFRRSRPAAKRAGSDGLIAARCASPLLQLFSRH